MSSIEQLTTGLEKDVNVSIEEIASKLLDKVNLELKTEIPFKDDVWNHAMLKSMGDHIEMLTSQIRLNFDIKDEQGNIVQVPFPKFMRAYYLRQVGYSEEYAVSLNREGRKEIVQIARGKFEERVRRGDMLSAISQGRM